MLAQLRERVENERVVLCSLTSFLLVCIIHLTVYQKLDVRHVIKHLKSHHAVVLEKRNYGLSLTYDRQKHIGNAHMDIATICNLQFMRNLVESLDDAAHLDSTCFVSNQE